MREYYQNKAAIVTGGASGIGLALCEMLLSLDARAVVLADLNAEKLNVETGRLAAAYPGKVTGIETDVAKEDSVAAMVRKASEFGGGIDLLFNNAGLPLSQAFDETTNEDWKRAFEINFYGALYGMRAVLPIMRAQGSGQIANTASGIGFIPMAYQSMYSATKSALIGLTGALRYEYWDDNIRISTIIPGTVATPIWDEAGGAPEGALTPDESARGILQGLKEDKMIIFVTDIDHNGAFYMVHPEGEKAMHEHLLGVARKRRKGERAI